MELGQTSAELAWGAPSPLWAALAVSGPLLLVLLASASVLAAALRLLLSAVGALQGSAVLGPAVLPALPESVVPLSLLGPAVLPALL